MLSHRECLDDLPCYFRRSEHFGIDDKVRTLAVERLALTQQLFSASLHQLGDGADYIEVAKIVAKMNGTTWD